jgi:hypothetical protein
MEHKDRSRGESKNWFAQRRFLVLGSIFLVLAGFAALGAYMLLAIKTHQQAPTGTHTKPTPTPTPVNLALSPNGVVLDSPHAMGTKMFTATGDWGFDWSYDCSKLKIPSHFLVSVYDSAGHVSTDTPPVIQSGLNGSGTMQYHKPGTYFLGVNSQCEWHITAKLTPSQQ